MCSFYLFLFNVITYVYTSGTALKKLLYILFVVNLILTPFYAQPSITWNRLYNGPFNYDDYGKGICQSTDGNFYLVGGSTSFSGISGFYIIKINPYGDTLWTKVLTRQGGFGFGSSAVPIPDGGCVVTGGDAIFVRFNAMGDTLWHKRYPSYKTCVDLKKTIDGGFIACGNLYNEWGYLIKVDSLGNLQWEHIYSSPYEKFLNSVELATDGGYIAVGRSQNFYGDTIKIWVLKTDFNGDSAWVKYLKLNNQEATGERIIRKDETYIVTTQKGFTRIDKFGNQFYSHNLTLEMFENIIDMDTTYNGKYVFTTIYYEQPNSVSRIIITDTSGNTIRSKNLNFSSVVQLENSLPLINNDIICMGWAEFYTQSRLDFYAVRLDSLLNTPPIGVEPINSTAPDKFYLFQNYPNPFNPTTKIKFDLPKSNLTLSGAKDLYVRLIIYDILGREIAVLVNQQLTPGTYEIEFSATGRGSNYPSGIYFYRLTAGEYYRV